MKILKGSEQRKLHQRNAYLSFLAEFNATCLAKQILAGDMTKLPEFHYYIRVLPDKSRIRLLEKLDKGELKQAS